MQIRLFARPLRAFGLLLALTAGLVASSATSSYGAHDLGYRWAPGTVGVINNAGLQWEPAIAQAVSDWNAISRHVELAVLPGNGGGCGETAGFIVVCQIQTRSLGVAQLYPAAGNFLRSVLITVGPRGLSSPAVSLSVMCHELGHALGLGHPDASSSSCLRELVGNLTPDPQDGRELNAFYEPKIKGKLFPECLRLLALAPVCL